MICEHEGCDKEGVECRIDDDSPCEYFCPEHAFEAGYCYCCGSFWGGIEEFDFGRIRGVCPHCRDEIESNESDGSDDDEIDYDDETWPIEMEADE